MARRSRPPAPERDGARPQIEPERFRALALDREALAEVLDGAPVTIAVPAPDGRMRRFAVHESAVMEPALAAAHPDIATYRGTGVDDPGSTIRLDLTPAGFHASVRGPGGAWYVDPYYQRDQSLYASYRGADLVENPHGTFVEREVPIPPAGRGHRGESADLGPATTLRTYRLALVSDPGYATYHGVSNVTAAKVTLINRVNQVYEDDFAVHMNLVGNNDLLNLNDAALMTGADGPCGAAACYTASQAAGCDTPTLDRTHKVIGQLIGASAYDVGHLGMGITGGGIAYLGVVGAELKGGGCTGVATPVGDLFAVDYVSHEIGHQFSGGHTFNGLAGSCLGNGGGPAVEPGSGSSVMAYAGICGNDNLQPHSDPYFSQRSIDQVSGYITSSLGNLDEVQTVSLRAFDGADSFKLTYNGAESPAITRGTNYNAIGIAAAIASIPGFPVGATASVTNWAGSSPVLDDTGFTVTFGGSLAGADVTPLSLTSTAGTTGFVGETDRGGPPTNGGTTSATGNSAPEVDAPTGFTIPARTPFSLTGSGTDGDGNTLSYLWEQNDDGSGTSLVSNTKPNGPLFRVFGTAANVSASDTLTSPSPGENIAGTSPTRVFPDPVQIASDNTNAATGSCPAAPPAPVPAAIVDCYSEFLPTSAYTGPMHFRLTARDGAGGVAHDDTTVTLANLARAVPGDLAGDRHQRRGGFAGGRHVVGRGHRRSARQRRQREDHDVHRRRPDVPGGGRGLDTERRIRDRRAPRGRDVAGAAQGGGRGQHLLRHQPRRLHGRSRCPDSHQRRPGSGRSGPVLGLPRQPRDDLGDRRELGRLGAHRHRDGPAGRPGARRGPTHGEPPDLDGRRQRHRPAGHLPGRGDSR